MARAAILRLTTGIRRDLKRGWATVRSVTFASHLSPLIERAPSDGATPGEGRHNRSVGNRLRVLILGSTGSIGTQALEVIAANQDRFEVVGLAAGGGTAARLRQRVGR